MRIINNILIKIFHRYVGCDIFGNKFYISKKKDADGKNIRSVIYSKINDPSSVQPEWESWLRHITDELPCNDEEKLYDWITKREPNMTGTKEAYSPINKDSNRRDKISADYKPWKP